LRRRFPSQKACTKTETPLGSSSICLLADGQTHHPPKISVPCSVLVHSRTIYSCPMIIVQ
jgi:hypothetical protein